MIAPRASICVLLATSIVGLAGGALAAGKIRLAQTSTVTFCMMNCNSVRMPFANRHAPTPNKLSPCLINRALAPVMLLQADRASRFAPLNSYHVKQRARVRHPHHDLSQRFRCDGRRSFKNWLDFFAHTRRATMRQPQYKQRDELSPPHGLPRTGAPYPTTVSARSARLCITANSGARLPEWVTSGHRTSSPIRRASQRRHQTQVRRMS
jgi:hypothetical protein